MPQRSVLSPIESESLLIWPEDHAQRVRLYSLSPTDIKAIRKQRGKTNRLGFAVLLCAMRYPGIVLEVGKNPPTWLLESLAEQLEIPAERWRHYSPRVSTRNEHVLELQSLYRFKTFEDSDERLAIDSILPVTLQSDRGETVAKALVENLRNQQILIPSLEIIERLCANAILLGEQQIYSKLCDALTSEHPQKLEELLQVTATSKTTRLRWLCQPPKAPNSRRF